MRKVEPMHVLGFFLFAGVSIFLVWYVFLSRQFDPFNLGFKTQVQGQIQVSSADGKTDETVVITGCHIPFSAMSDLRSDMSLIFSASDSELEMRILDDGQRRHEQQNARLAYRSSNANEALESCDWYLFDVSTVFCAGRSCSGGAREFSGEVKAVCKGERTNASYEVALKFQNCGF